MREQGDAAGDVPPDGVGAHDGHEAEALDLSKWRVRTVVGLEEHALLVPENRLLLISDQLTLAEWFDAGRWVRLEMLGQG